ncbi:mRNA cap guanine-N7 methyltransferase-like [Hyalella azteca]|uniref:mRNA cap guanine-N(7) methyltransferase n=1 Tax=Hyalella azteca TaxID=294128 RepID=A0A8B7MZG4_HYAAZ|nr:mRNA cap guanine-N7 methyltransferase-like [Hyalella azteca]
MASVSSCNSTIRNNAAGSSMLHPTNNVIEDNPASNENPPTGSIKRKFEEPLGSIVAGHYNNLEEKGLSARNESRILYMRNFNNWIKSYLINKFMNMVRENFHTHSLAAVDLGCGKGGDLLKWTKANIGHLICVDIAETSVRQCKERYEFNKQKRFGAPRFSAEFIVADCTKVCFQSLLGDPTRRVHIVSCQFAFHYCFESLQQAETMVKNAASNLATGGFFLLTIPDANYIMKKLSSEKSNAFGNEVFRIEFPDDRPEVPLLFGDRYQFFLEGAVDCPEFLVHQPTLKRLCLKYGLECVYQKRFSDVYKDAMQDEQSRMLLQKMSALEPYPSPSGTQSSSNSQEYVAACEHLKQQQSDSNVRPCTLTLSASEWQATNIYTALAFKKIELPCQ